MTDSPILMKFSGLEKLKIATVKQTEKNSFLLQID